MMIGVWCELVCGVCSTSASGRWVFETKIPRDALKKEATKDGWKYYKEDAFCSDQCLKSFKEQEKDGTQTPH